MSDFIVVGVDGSPNAERALDWAIAEARVRGASLKLVTAFEDPVTTVGLGTAFGAGAPIMADPGVIEGAAKDVADAAAKRITDVPFEVIARADRPSALLVDVSQGAAMLVVGSRGHGAVGSLLLGSVSNYVVHHAQCPIVIVPHVA